MTRILFALLALALMSCTIWQPYMQAPPTPAPTVTNVHDVVNIATTTPTPVFSIQIENCTVTADFLNVRSGPGTNYPAVSWLRSGDVVAIRHISGAWLKLDTGWIHGSFCDGK